MFCTFSKLFLASAISFYALVMALSKVTTVSFSKCCTIIIRIQSARSASYTHYNHCFIG